MKFAKPKPKLIRKTRLAADKDDFIYVPATEERHPMEKGDVL